MNLLISINGVAFDKDVTLQEAGMFVDSIATLQAKLAKTPL